MLANPKRTKDEIVQWIRSYFESNGPGCDAVVGISGGKDSSVVAALCVEALGKERVVGVMMPNGEQPDLDDSKQLIEFLGIRYAYTDISKAVSAVSDQVALNMNVSDQTRINLPPRIRMATLYAISQSLPHGGRVANTCNRSEDYVGYSTKFGDSAGDFSPLANLMVHEVIQIGYELLLPINLISKTPSDGLCGKTDEDNLGFTYAHLDAYIMYGTSGIEEIDKKIASMHDHNLHKLNPIVKLFRQRGYTVIATHIANGQDFFAIDPPKCDYIISNPPYSLKGEVFERLFQLNIPFAMLVGVVGLFESQKRFKMFREHDFEIMYLNRRVSYFKNYADQKPSLNPPFSSVYVCKGMLPKQIIFEEIQKTS